LLGKKVEVKVEVKVEAKVEVKPACSLSPAGRQAGLRQPEPGTKIGAGLKLKCCDAPRSLSSKKALYSLIIPRCAFGE
jgi:hypothetical protein